MIKLDNIPTSYWDIDDTLVFWHNDVNDDPKDYDTIINVNGFDNHVKIHWKHVNQLKRFKMRGYNVVVWSKAGSDWAERVIKTLELDKYVDIILPKPLFYFDDQDSANWMGERRYDNP